MPELTFTQWALLALGAFMMGLSKTGIAGLGILTVALFANILPALKSTGVLLPLLILADLFAVALFRKHADWRHIWRLFPWVLAGLPLGFLVMGRAGAGLISRLIGAILLAMAALHLWRRDAMARDPEGLAARLPHAAWFAGCTGILAGFTTMVANAAGPVMVLYLLAMGLSKRTYLGTMAWFFLLVNVSKVPLSWQLNLVNANSLALDGPLVLPLLSGVALGPLIVRYLSQRVFEGAALVLTVAAAVRLIL
jgi:uncharacterized protein